MKALFLSHQSADHLGGAELSLVRIIDAWVHDDASREPIVVSPSPAGAITALARTRGWSTTEIPFEGWAVASAHGGRAERKLRDLAAKKATRTIVDLIRREGVELVVTNTIVAPWAALAAAIAGIPHVWFVREFAFAEQGLNFPGGRESALTDAGQLSHTVVANSVALKAELGRWIDESTLRVIYPPVDLDGVRSLGEDEPAVPTGFTPGRLSVAVVGRVTRSKGQWRVIEALGLLAAEECDVDVCFVGGVIDQGADRELTQRARRLGVRGSVVFTGERANPFPFMRAADVCIVPTDIEAFGRVTLESLALGTPVIATRQGAGAELIVPGETGELFDADDVSELARALRLYADDPTRARAQSTAARGRADALMSEEFGMARALDILRDATQAPGRPVPTHWSSWTAETVSADLPDLSAPWHWEANARVHRARALAWRALRHPDQAWRKIVATVTRA